MSWELRLTLTRPGVVTCHLPRGLESVQTAPLVGSVLIAMVSDEPFTIEAQPDTLAASAATSATILIFIKGSPASCETAQLRSLFCPLHTHRPIDLGGYAASDQ